MRRMTSISSVQKARRQHILKNSERPVRGAARSILWRSEVVGAVIRFTTGDMVVGDTSTMDSLLPVYQGGANGV